MNKEIQQRLQWVRLYEETGNAGLVCRRCGICQQEIKISTFQDSKMSPGG